MNMKKLVLIGAVALVVVGCVIAAGCTSTPTTQQTGTGDSIAGIWSTTFTDAGQNVKCTLTVLSNGAGYLNCNYENGTSKVFALTWAKNADGTYAIKMSSGNSHTWTLNSAKDKISSSTGRTMTRTFAETSDAGKIVGVWVNNGSRSITTFNADGSGTTYKGAGKEISKFTWTSPEAGKIKVHYVSGTSTSTGEKLAGKETTLIYDADKGTLTNPESGSVRVRPMESMDGFTLFRLSAEPIVGQWTAKYSQNGKTADAVLTLRNDGQGYWMLLGDEAGIQITNISRDTWKKTGANTYVISSGSGKTFETTYDPAKDTLTLKGTQNGQNTYTRLDPLVGVWYGTAAPERGSGSSTMVVNPKGTGVAAISYDNGSAVIANLTWKKNTDGTYAMGFNGGTKQTYTVASDGKTLKTADGRTKTKLYLDTSFLMSVTGPWYNKDNDRLMFFNGDGTGVGFLKNDGIKFTWKVNDIGKFAVTYLDGTAKDGSSLKGKTLEWTFDRENNVFSSSNGIKYTRPQESVKDKIILV